MRLRYKLPLILALLLAAYLSVTAALALICYPDPDITKLDCFADSIELPGIRRMAKVNENFYRGALPTGEAFAALKKLGIRTIVDLHGFGKDENYVKGIKSSGFKYFPVLLTDEPPSPETVDRFLSIVNDSNNQPVYVHCKRGKTRTGVMLALYRMRCEGWSNKDAYNEMLYFGFTIFHRETFFFGSCEVHTELAEFVKGYRPPVVSP